VGRADAAGGEDIIVARPQSVDGGDDLGLVVGDDARFLQADAGQIQLFGQIGQIGVLGAAGQDFVADDEQGGRDRLRRFAGGILLHDTPMVFAVAGAMSHNVTQSGKSFAPAAIKNCPTVDACPCTIDAD
jgi:hypothetical protein